MVGNSERPSIDIRVLFFPGGTTGSAARTATSRLASFRVSKAPTPPPRRDTTRRPCPTSTASRPGEDDDQADERHRHPVGSGGFGRSVVAAQNRSRRRRV